MSSAMTWPFQLTAARRRLVVNWLTALGAWWFQLTAARRRLAYLLTGLALLSTFQLTAARRRLGHEVVNNRVRNLFQLTAARRRLVDRAERLDQKDYVSTHSRPKAAGLSVPMSQHES